MEQLIKKIIAVDKQARGRTEQSKEQLAQSKIIIAQRVKELEEQYDKSVKEIIDLTTEEEAQNVETQKAEIDRKFAEANRQLDETYAQHKDQWADEMYHRALGQS